MPTGQLRQQLRLARERLVRGPLREDDRPRERPVERPGRPRGAQRYAVAGRAGPGHGQQHLAAPRIAHHADEGDVVHGQGQRERTPPEAVREVRGAVDGVQVPGGCAGGGPAALLLTDHQVARELRRQHAPHPSLDGAVDVGHQVGRVGLRRARGRSALPEVLRGPTRQRAGDRCAVPQVDGDGAAAIRPYRDRGAAVQRCGRRGRARPHRGQ